MAIAFELLRLLGELRYKILPDSDSRSRGDSTPSFRARMQNVCGDALSRGEVIVECAYCFQKAVAAHPLYPGYVTPTREGWCVCL